jgi:hypothetical protein
MQKARENGTATVAWYPNAEVVKNWPEVVPKTEGAYAEKRATGAARALPERAGK